MFNSSTKQSRAEGRIRQTTSQRFQESHWRRLTALAVKGFCSVLGIECILNDSRKASRLDRFSAATAVLNQRPTQPTPNVKVFGGGRRDLLDCLDVHGYCFGGQTFDLCGEFFNEQFCNLIVTETGQGHANRLQSSANGWSESGKVFPATADD